MTLGVVVFREHETPRAPLISLSEPLRAAKSGDAPWYYALNG